MKEIVGKDIWDLYYNVKDIPLIHYNAVVITTNGYVKNDGACVMGRGIAKEAKKKFPEFPYRVGRALKQWGNHVAVFRPNVTQFNIFASDPTLITFPVKPAYGSSGEPGWKAKATIELIARSAQEISTVANLWGYTNILMPRPGCGNGGLKWEDVKPHIEDLLDDRFTVVTNERN